MAAPHKYLFDTSFDQPDRPQKASPPPAPPVEPTFSRADLEATRAAAHAEGRAEALDEARRSTDQQTADALGAIAHALTGLADSGEQMTGEMQRQAAAILRTVIHKAVPQLCRKDPSSEIEALFVDCLREAFEEPRVVLRVAPALFESVQSRLPALAAQSGFAGKLVLLADDGLAGSDCRVEWADGGAERNTKRLLADIDAALARLESIPTQNPTAPEEPSDE